MTEGEKMIWAAVFAQGLVRNLRTDSRQIDAEDFAGAVDQGARLATAAVATARLGLGPLVDEKVKAFTREMLG